MVADRGPQLRAFVIAMMIVAILTIILRFWSRAVSKARQGQRSKFWWDDWIALMSLPVILTSLSLTLTKVAFGVGRHIDTLLPENIPKILKVSLANELVGNLAITVPKISALFFYVRIFGTSSRLFRYSLWIIHFCVLGWLIALSLLTMFSCTPIKKQWLPTTPGHCITTSSIYLGSAIPSVVIDLLILLVPLPILWKLQMNKSRKFLIINVFLLGYCVIVLSLGRLITVIKSETQLDKDFTFAGVEAFYWVSAEPVVSLLSVSLPSIFFLVRRLFHEGVSSLFTSRNATTRARIRGNGDAQTFANNTSQVNKYSQNGFVEAAHELDRHSYDSRRNILHLVPGGPDYQVSVSMIASNGSNGSPKSLSEDQIRVQSEVKVNFENMV